MTITEALAEIKTIGKRLEKKRQSVLAYLARDARLKDPMERDGGSVEFIRKERQAIGDLERRIIELRDLIQRRNISTPLTIGGITQSVAEWLTWRREVAKPAGQFLAMLGSSVQNVRKQVAKEGRRTVESDREAKSDDVIVCVNEKELTEEIERHEQILGDLDGKLSLVNATTHVE